MPLDSRADTRAGPDANEGPPIIGARYELFGLLGSGGMGNVYKARDTELDEIVALKVLRPELVGAHGALERFRSEVKLARRVTHPNVARVFDIGEQGGSKLLTMELVDGEPLSAWLERDRIPPIGWTLDTVSLICAGVGAAHAAGVVHRDLKPDNVLLAKDGRVVVTDFGIASAIADDKSQTGVGIIGTPAYMAPEQVLGQSAIDERADVYAFGVMLYEMLTGTLPWEGDSPLAVAAARLDRPPPDARSVRPDLDPKLAALTFRCMAMNPSDRFGSMASIAAEIATIARPRGAPPLETRARNDGDAIEPAAKDKRVAVLPFRNFGASDDEYIADAITEDLIDTLSSARGLRVHSGGVVRRYKGHEGDPRQLGRELGAQVIVEGSIRKTPGSFRISARVVSVSDGIQLWAKRFEGTDAQILSLSDDLAHAVARAVTVDLKEPTRDVEEDADAVDLYLRARAAHHRFYASNPETVIALFEKALARSPDDPRIIAGCVMSRVRKAYAEPGEMEATRKEADRAVKLAPSLPDAHVGLGALLLHTGEEHRAVQSLRRALRLTSNCADAHDLLGRILSEADRDEGRKHLETALLIDPALEFSRTALTRHHALRGDWPMAFATMHEGMSLPVESRFCLWRRDSVRAKQLLDLLAPISAPRLLDLVVRAYLEAAVGGVAPSPSLFVPLPTAKPRTRAFLAQMHAEIACALGDYIGAAAALEECEQSFVFDLAWIDRCPPLEPLKSTLAFVNARTRIAERSARVLDAYLAKL